MIRKWDAMEFIEGQIASLKLQMKYAESAHELAKVQYALNYMEGTLSGIMDIPDEMPDLPRYEKGIIGKCPILRVPK